MSAPVGTAAQATPAARRAAARRRFDRIAAGLIGAVAILAAIFALEQAWFGLESTRAQVNAARLSTDATAKLGATSHLVNASVVAQQRWVLLGMEGIARQIAGTSAGDGITAQIGAAQQAASEQYRAAIDETVSSAVRGLDPYMHRLLSATNDSISAEVENQNTEVDAAADAGARAQRAVLGLSITTLAGVLAGVAAVLGVGRAGWGTLGAAWLAGAVAAITAVLVLL